MHCSFPQDKWLEHFVFPMKAYGITQDMTFSVSLIKFTLSLIHAARKKGIKLICWLFYFSSQMICIRKTNCAPPAIIDYDGEIWQGFFSLLAKLILFSFTIFPNHYITFIVTCVMQVISEYKCRHLHECLEGTPASIIVIIIIIVLCI